MKRVVRAGIGTHRNTSAFFYSLFWHSRQPRCMPKIFCTARPIRATHSPSSEGVLLLSAPTAVDPASVGGPAHGMLTSDGAGSVWRLAVSLHVDSRYTGTDQPISSPQTPGRGWRSSVSDGLAVQASDPEQPNNSTARRICSQLQAPHRCKPLLKRLRRGSLMQTQ